MVVLGDGAVGKVFLSYHILGIAVLTVIMETALLITYATGTFPVRTQEFPSLHSR